MLLCLVSRGSKEFHQIDVKQDVVIHYSELSDSFVICFKENHKQKMITLKRFDVVGNVNG